MIKFVTKSPDLDEDQQIETDLVFLLNCYKSREESAQSIREFYGRFSENRNKFADFETLQQKIHYFSDEFCFHDKVISLTEDEISTKYLSLKANSTIKKQLLSKFVNNIFKITSTFINKLSHGNYEEEHFKLNEYTLMSNLFRDNALSILKEENLNIFKLINFIIRTSRTKLQTEIKKLKLVFLSNQTKAFFEMKTLNLNENLDNKKTLDSPNFKKKQKSSKKTSKSQKKVCKSLMDQTFKVDAFHFLDSVRRKYIVPNALNLPMTSKKNGKLIVNQSQGVNPPSNSKLKPTKKQPKSIIQIPTVYNILQISELKPTLHHIENPNELITEKFERMFNELMKANSGTSQTLRKYHEDFMKHVEKKKLNEKLFLGVKHEIEVKQEKPKSEAKIEVKISIKEQVGGNRRSISVTKD